MISFQSRPAGLRARLESHLTLAWQRRGWLAWLLWPFSLLFGLISALRRLSFRRGWQAVQDTGLPVIVVGNVTLGGTGKTPVVIALVEALRAAGHVPGVISRGYGARIDAPQAVHAGSPAALAGDEPVLIAQRTGAPVWVCRDRPAAARALRAAHPEVNVIVSDDGLQHYRLGRAVELVVFDHRLGGNGFLLPAGPLREPLSRRRDATLINNPYSHALPPGPDTYALTLTPAPAWRLNDRTQRRALADFTGERVLAAAGIGAPERFFALLRAAGLSPDTLPLPDHYAFAQDPFAGSDADAILITEKDAVKCADWDDARIWVLPVQAVLAPRLIELVVEKVRGHSSA